MRGCQHTAARVFSRTAVCFDPSPISRPFLTVCPSVRQMARCKKGATTSAASNTLLVAVCISTLALTGGIFVKAAEDGSCSATAASGSGGGACQAPVSTERAGEAPGGLFGGFSFGSLTSLFGVGESLNYCTYYLLGFPTRGCCCRHAQYRLRKMIAHGYTS